MLIGLGYHEVNLNLGCPAATVVSKKKGSGFLDDPDRLNRFFDGIFEKMSFLCFPLVWDSFFFFMGAKPPNRVRFTVGIAQAKIPLIHLVCAPSAGPSMEGPALFPIVWFTINLYFAQ